MKPTATLGGGQMKVTVFMIIVGIIFFANCKCKLDTCTVEIS